MIDAKERLKKLTSRAMQPARIYAVMLLIMFAFSILNYALPYERLGFDTRQFVRLQNDWVQVLEDGTERPIARLPADLHDKENEEIIIRSTLPEEFPISSPSLFVRSAHQNVIVRINGEEIYRYEFKALHRYDSDFPPTQWLILRLNDEYAGQEIELSLTRHQKDGSYTVDEIFLGGKADVLFELVRISLFPLLCGVVLFLMGTVFIIRHLVSPVRRELGNRNLYVGATLVLISLWMFCNTEVRQLIFQNVLFVRNLEFMTLMMMPVPVILSLDYSEQGKFKEIARQLCMDIFGVDLVIMALVFSGVQNFLNLLWLIYLTLGIAALFVISSFFAIARKDPALFRSMRITVIAYGVLVLGGTLEALNLSAFAGRHRGILISLGLIGYAVGVTIEQSHSQRKMITQVQQAKMESRAKSDFLASMSHEIRTPINAMLGMDEMILRESTEPAVLSYATDIQHAGEHLLTLINDILDLSRIESGHMELEESDYDLSALLMDITDLIRIHADEKGLKFEVKIHAVTPNRLRGDAGRIRQIAINLLNNAVKYTKKGRVVFSVDSIPRVEARVLWESAVVKEKKTPLENPAFLRMTIRDTGIGIREEDIPTLFDSFQRLDKEANAGIQGTGLGLSIVGVLVRMMHGCILVKSVYGVGSEFTVIIPQEELSNERLGSFSGRREKLRSTQRDQALFTAPGARVLAVDDNELNRRLIEALLRRTQVQLTVCASGQECLDAVRAERYDLILMDHLMPEMDGIETLHRMQKMPDNRCAGAPVLVLTANAVAGAKEEYLKQGFADYLSKPIQSAELEKMMMRYLPQEKLRMEAERNIPTAGAMIPKFPDWLYSVEELDVAQGLQFCATAEIYLDTLKIYAKNTASSADEIEALYCAGDTEGVTVKVHALKSTSRAIGAEGIGALAEKLESAGKAGDTQTIDAELDGLLVRCRALGERLAPLLKSEENPEKELPAISQESLRKTYDRILELVGEFEYDRAASMIGALDGVSLPDGESERRDRLKRAAENFDWDEISEILT